MLRVHTTALLRRWAIASRVPHQACRAYPLPTPSCDGCLGAFQCRLELGLHLRANMCKTMGACIWLYTRVCICLGAPQCRTSACVYTCAVKHTHTHMCARVCVYSHACASRNGAPGHLSSHKPALGSRSHDSGRSPRCKTKQQKKQQRSSKQKTAGYRILAADRPCIQPDFPTDQPTNQPTPRLTCGSRSADSGHS